MVGVGDLFGNPILLKMEAYKAINRELTVKNQELRQYVGVLRDEVTRLNQKIIEVREGQHEMKRSIVKIVTKAFNLVLQLLFPESVENDLSNSILMLAKTAKRLSKTPNKQTMMASDEETLLNSPTTNTYVRSPLAEIQKNSNITQRNKNRRYGAKEVACEQQCDTDIESDEGISEQDREYESELELNHLSLPAILEEIDSQGRNITNPCANLSNIEEVCENSLNLIDRSLSKSKNGSARCVFEKTKQASSKCIRSYMEDGASFVDDSASLQENSNHKKSLVTQESMLNESSFNGLSLLKAKSSTPYKTSQELQNVKVMVPRLKPDMISRLTLSVDSKGNQTEHQAKKSKNEKSSSKSGKFNKTDTENSDSLILNRPKRKAAQAATSTLTEPKLKVKLRRPF